MFAIFFLLEKCRNASTSRTNLDKLLKNASDQQNCKQTETNHSENSFGSFKAKVMTKLQLTPYFTSDVLEKTVKSWIDLLHCLVEYRKKIQGEVLKEKNTTTNYNIIKENVIAIRNNAKNGIVAKDKGYDTNMDLLKKKQEVETQILDLMDKSKHDLCLRKYLVTIPLVESIYEQCKRHPETNIFNFISNVDEETKEKILEIATFFDHDFEVVMVASSSTKNPILRAKQLLNKLKK